MTEQDFNDLQRHSAIQDARISNLETKFEMFMQSVKESNEILKAELKDFKDEMRQQNQMRADEISEIRQKNEENACEIRQKNEELNAKIDDKFERLLNQLQNMAIAAVVGVGAVVAAVVSLMK